VEGTWDDDTTAVAVSIVDTGDLLVRKEVGALIRSDFIFGE
jgi:hypothetical protein